MSIENISVKFAKKQHFPPSAFGSTSKGSDSGSGSLVIGEGPKKYFPPTYGKTEVLKASCRLVEPVHRCNEAPIRVPVPQASQLKFTSFERDRERRHIREKDAHCVSVPKDRELNWTTKKTVMCGDNNLPRHSYKSEEYSLESKFDRKQRVDEANLGKRRNYISVSSMGDKCYKFSEQSPGFFKDGGLIPGSSIVQRTPASSVPKAADATGGRFLKSLTAHEKRELEIMKDDITSIGTLTNSYYKRGQHQPSWEEKTGMWLCRPEDEND